MGVDTDVDDSSHFVYSKPLRLTASQLKSIAECRDRRRKRQYQQKQEQEQKEQHFRLPAESSSSLSSPQWTTASISSSEKIQFEQEIQIEKRIEREIDLAVSSNLIFNIALSHHLIATTTPTTITSTTMISITTPIVCSCYDDDVNNVLKVHYDYTNLVFVYMLNVLLQRLPHHHHHHHHQRQLE